MLLDPLFVEFDVPIRVINFGPADGPELLPGTPWRHKNSQSDLRDRFERQRYKIGAIAAFEYAIAT